VSYLPRCLEGLRGWVGVWAFLAANFFLLVTGANGKELTESGLARGWIVAGMGLAVGLWQPERVLARSWDATTARAIVVLSVLPWMVIGARFDPGRVPDELGRGLAWLAQFAIAILVIRAGVRAGASGWVNLGYLAIVIGIVTRYFDFFGAYLEGGTALALTGVLILFLLYAAERARRRTLARKEVAA
jgi:uncharacterized membrane protein